MLSLPSKPWKKVKIEALAAGRYRLRFVSEMPDEETFRTALAEDIAPCLGTADELAEPDWPTRSVVLATLDLPTFKRNLVFACVMVDIE